MIEPHSHTLHDDTPQTEVIATGNILGNHEMPGSHSQKDRHIRAFTAAECQQVSDRIATTRRCIYRGRGVGLQVPWAIPTYHLLLVVSLFSGIGTSSMALFLLGAQFIAVHAECEEDAVQCSSRSFPHAVHIRFAQQITGHLFKRVLERRKFAGIIVGGGSPCQPNSWLNKKRRGASDPRCHLARHISRIAGELSLIHI